METRAGRKYEHTANNKAQGINYLLAIGIDAYQHCPPLRNCVKDVSEIVSVLQQRFNFEVTNTYTLFNTEATRKNILKAFRDVQVRIQPQDNLVVYFSGHGDTVHQLGYWIPVEAKPSEEDEYISADEIVNRLNAIPSFHTFLIVDACFSGALFQSTKNVSVPRRSDEIHRSRWGLTASHSRELALDGTAGDNSPFAECLLMRLRQTPEPLSVHDLSSFVINEVRRRTRDTQTPIAQPLPVRGHELGQFVFHLRKDENQDWAAAKQENTLAAYERFLQHYPDGIHADEAHATITFLQEEIAWQQATKDNTIFAYERYLRTYPDGHYVRLALEAQETLEIEEAWQRTTRRNSIPAYREFFGLYPNSRYAAEAEARIQQLLNPTPVEPATPVREIPKVLAKETLIATPTKKAFNYKPYLFSGIGGLLLIIVVMWIWSLNNNNKQTADTQTQTNLDSISNNQAIDTPTTTLQQPTVTKEETPETTTPQRSSEVPKQDNKTTTTTKPAEVIIKETAATKTPPKTEPKEEVPPPPTIDRARIKKLFTDAIQLLRFEETREDAKTKLQEVLRLDEKNAIAKDALLLIRAGDIDGAIAQLKKAQ